MTIHDRKVKQIAAVFLFLLVAGCSKNSTDTTTPTPTQQATTCQIQKIAYGTGGEYELYTFDANGFLTGFASYAKDQTGKLPTSVNPDKYIYLAQGLLDRITWGDGTGYEQYSYGNGALTKMEATINGKIAYRIDVTTDANKRITALKSTNVAKNPDYGFDYSTKYTLDAQGRYIRTEATGPDGLFLTEDEPGFDTSVQDLYLALKGVPIYAGTPITQYGTAQPIADGLPSRIVDQYAYDDNGKFIGLKKVYDGTITRVANSNKYPVSRKDVDAASGAVGNSLYTYSNCK